MLNPNKRFRNSMPSASKGPAPIKQTATENSPAKITIDFPKEGESINSMHYSFKIATHIPGVKVDVSLNGGGWVPCREAAGHWWFDWSAYSTGTYKLQARAALPGGAVELAREVKFSVIL
jgi:hypothetical protein